MNPKGRVKTGVLLRDQSFGRFALFDVLVKLQHEAAVAFACNFELHKGAMSRFLGAVGVLDCAFKGGVAARIEFVDCLAEIAKARNGEKIVHRPTDEARWKETGHSSDTGVSFGNTAKLVVAYEPVGCIAKGSGQALLVGVALLGLFFEVAQVANGCEHETLILEGEVAETNRYWNRFSCSHLDAAVEADDGLLLQLSHRLKGDHTAFHIGELAHLQSDESFGGLSRHRHHGAIGI